LIQKDAAFYNTAVDATSHVGDHLVDDPQNTFADTEAMIAIARRFLKQSAPTLLEVFDDSNQNSKSTSDRLVKIGRNVSSTMRFARRKSSSVLLEEESSNNNDNKPSSYSYSKEKIDASLALLADECTNLAALLKDAPIQVPKVRFGKTELQMPVVTLGCMRFQQSWNRGSGPAVFDITNVKDECQENLVEIIRHAYHCGITHIETAKMYGTSQLQIGVALKQLFDAGEIQRKDLIIQTKGAVSSGMTIQGYKTDVLNSFQLLKLDYVDLFSVHGLNTQQDYDALFSNSNRNDNLIIALQELKKEGKIRHIGFSSHGPADLIQRCIETNAFDYANLHYHFCGSYTASGDLEDGRGNLSNIRLAHSKDMGVFVISGYDKGGRLYAPSNKLRDLCLPDMEPMTYGSVWLWQHAIHHNAPIHTFVVGAARPSDLDQPVLASHLLYQDQNELSNRRQRITDRLTQAMEDALGKKWVQNWHVGVPNAHASIYQTHHTGLVWTYNLIHGWGMLDFAKDRYAPMVGHLKKWSSEKTKEENMKKMGPGFAWMPGTAIDTTLDYTQDFVNCPEENKDTLLKAIQFVHEWASKKENNKIIPLEWETAYDMRPWTAFPER